MQQVIILSLILIGFLISEDIAIKIYEKLRVDIDDER